MRALGPTRHRGPSTSRCTTTAPPRRIAAFALVAALAALLVPPAAAVDVPPAGAVFTIQTNGPDAAVGLGDFYTSTSAGAGYHYLEFGVPCSWPQDLPLAVQLFSPEMNTDAAVLATSEEQAGTPDVTEFELYGPGVTAGPGAAEPAPGAGTVAARYDPSVAGVPEGWVTFATLAAPVTCGTYTLRAETEGDDQNGWRLRVGHDDDDDPATPAIDDPDGLPGTDDEVTIGIAQTSYQQDSGDRACFDLFEYVEPGTPSIAINNFDYDGTGIPGSSITYVSPSGAQVDGTTSGPSATWNASGATATIERAGDVVSDPEPGWWRLSSCVSNHNQFIQEGTSERAAYYVQPPTPELEVAKDDGRTVVDPGDRLTYAVEVENVATGPSAGAARSVVATDTIPSGTGFVGCTFVAPAVGTCTASGGVVTAALDGPLVAGASVSFEVVVDVDETGLPFPVPPLTNAVSVAFEDSLGNTFLPVTATDIDTVGTASIGDTVYLDRDGDGVQDPGETGLADVPVTLVFAGEDGVLGTADDGVLTTTTDGAGGYLLTDLRPGAYRVVVDPGDVPGASPTQGADGIEVILASDQEYLDADFGFARGSIGDLVWLDLDADGVQDDGEPGLAGVTVTVTGLGPDGLPGTGDDVTVSVTTDADGRYLVEGLPAGDYTVDVDASTAPTGTALVSGTDLLPVTLGPGEAVLDADFGFAGTGSIGDLVWLDLDADGVQDPGEDGIEGVDVVVTWSGPDGLPGTGDDLVLGTTTGPDGRYLLPGLPFGGYVVSVDEETLPVGVRLVSGLEAATVSLDAAGPTRDDVDFGYRGAPDLVLAKSLLGPIRDGEEARWEVTVTNVGAGPTAGPLTVTDSLVAELGAVSATGAGFVCTVDGQVVTCERAEPLAPGETVALALVTAVDAEPGAVVTNVASVVLDGAEVDPTDNDDTARGQVLGAAASPIPPGGGALPRTGTEAAATALVAWLLIGAGAVLVVRFRRLGRA